MKKFFLASFLLFAVPAYAGTITITVTTAAAPCNTGNCTKTYNVPDADLAKVVTSYQFHCQVVGAPPCTTPQTIVFWFNSMIQDVVANVTAFYRQQAATAVVPINPQ